MKGKDMRILLLELVGRLLTRLGDWIFGLELKAAKARERLGG